MATSQVDLAAILARLDHVEAQLAADDGAEFCTKHAVARYLNVDGRTVLRLTDEDGILHTTKIRGQRRWDMREVRAKYPRHSDTA